MEHLQHPDPGLLAAASGDGPLLQTEARTEGPSRTLNFMMHMRRSPFTTLLIAVVAGHVSAAMADAVPDRIIVTVRGKGTDVVLIPGLASSSAEWDATAKHLEDRHRLHVIQIAGFAGSP